MNKNYIILDCSGSMMEMGHNDVLKEAALAIKRGYPEVSLFRWSDTVNPLSKLKDIVPQGQADVPALTAFIKDCAEETGILLISDGVWGMKNAETIHAAAGKRFLQTCAVGIGADLYSLKKAQTYGAKVAQMADLPSVMKRLTGR